MHNAFLSKGAPNDETAIGNFNQDAVNIAFCTFNNLIMHFKTADTITHNKINNVRWCGHKYIYCYSYRSCCERVLKLC